MSFNRSASSQSGKRASRGLGRGLSSLLGNNEIDHVTRSSASVTSATNLKGLHQVPVEWINVGPWQPRHRFDGEGLEELAVSIREKGVVQPILLRPDPKNPTRYQLVAGERRWRAAQLAKLHELPAIIRELDDIDCYEIALIENVQRSDLSVIEEAQGYQKLLDTKRYSQKQLSEMIGKSRSHIANLLRLLGLPSQVQMMLLERQLTMGQARPLIGHPRAEVLAQIIYAKELSARQVEALVKSELVGAKKSVVKIPKSADIKALEKTASQKLGLVLRIDWNEAKERGKVTIECGSLDQMTDFLDRMGIS
jgi:ParB family chromosome partitioning protein